MLCTGSEHQGQTSISDIDQNLGFTCIFSSGMQEKLFCHGIAVYISVCWYVRVIFSVWVETTNCSGGLTLNLGPELGCVTYLNHFLDIQFNVYTFLIAYK